MKGLAQIGACANPIGFSWLAQLLWVPCGPFLMRMHHISSCNPIEREPQTTQKTGSKSSWCSSGPWKLQYFLNEIKHLSSFMKVEFWHILPSANKVLAVMLAKKGIIMWIVVIHLFVGFELWLIFVCVGYNTLIPAIPLTFVSFPFFYFFLFLF